MPPFLLAALTLAQMLLASNAFSKSGTAQPSALSDAISKLMAMLEAGDFHAPSSVDAILADLLDAVELGRDLLPADIQARFDSIEGLLKKSQASLANLKSGQVAEVAAITMSFDGKEVPVDVFAIRRDSTANVAQDLGLAS